MADDIQFKLAGVDALLSKLATVSDEVKRKGGRYALRKAAQLVANAARENAQRLDNPGTRAEISKNIVVRWNKRLFKNSGQFGFRIGILGGAKLQKNYHTRRGRKAQMYEIGGDDGNPGGNTFYWRFLEFGTSKMAAKPFMRTALSSNIEAATSTFITEFERAIDRAIRREAASRRSS